MVKLTFKIIGMPNFEGMPSKSEFSLETSEDVAKRLATQEFAQTNNGIVAVPGAIPDLTQTSRDQKRFDEAGAQEILKKLKRVPLHRDEATAQVPEQPLLPIEAVGLGSGIEVGSIDSPVSGRYDSDTLLVAIPDLPNLQGKHTPETWSKIQEQLQTASAGALLAVEEYAGADIVKENQLSQRNTMAFYEKILGLKALRNREFRDKMKKITVGASGVALTGGMFGVAAGAGGAALLGGPAVLVVGGIAVGAKKLYDWYREQQAAKNIARGQVTRTKAELIRDRIAAV